MKPLYSLVTWRVTRNSLLREMFYNSLIWPHEAAFQCVSHHHWACCALLVVNIYYNKWTKNYKMFKFAFQCGVSCLAGVMKMKSFLFLWCFALVTMNKLWGEWVELIVFQLRRCTITTEEEQCWVRNVPSGTSGNLPSSANLCPTLDPRRGNIRDWCQLIILTFYIKLQPPGTFNVSSLFQV